MVILRDKVLKQLPVELTNSWISIVDERKFNADVGELLTFGCMPTLFKNIGAA